MPIHIHSLLFLFISSVLIPLFVIALNFSFPFILISTHPILSLLSFYPFSILQSISSYLSFHPTSLLYSILIHPLIILPIHSFHIILSHSILIPSFILFHFNTTLLYSSSSLFYKPLFDSILSFYSILLFVPRLLSITILLLLLLLLTPLSTIILFHNHSHTLHSVHSLLSYLSFFLLEPSSLPSLFIPLLSISFNHFFHHIINHFLLLFPIHFNHSSFNKHNNQIST